MTHPLHVYLSLHEGVSASVYEFVLVCVKL